MNNNGENKERQFSIIEKALLWIIGIICLMSIIIYIFQLHEKQFANAPEDFSAFGSYIGGILSPLIALISVILLYRTYRTQLDITRHHEKQLYMQQFENTFFSLLNNQRTILMSCKGIFYDSTKIKRKGETLSDYQYINKITEELKIQMLNFEYEPSLLEENNIDLLKTIINDYYIEVFSKHIPQLSHYFRHLYHILKYVDKSKIDDKKQYIDLVQSQMSDDELYMSFYNGISVYGQERMLPLMDNYSFLENIKYNDDNLRKHCKLFYKNTTLKTY